MNNGRVTLEDIQGDAELRLGLRLAVSERQKERRKLDLLTTGRRHVCSSCGSWRPASEEGCAECERWHETLQARVDYRARQKAKLAARWPQCPGVSGSRPGKGQPYAGSCPKFARFEVEGEMYCKVHAKVVERLLEEGSNGSGAGAVEQPREGDSGAGHANGRGRSGADRPARPSRRIGDLQA